jgi:class 3 adenylate cyclase
MSIGFFVRSHQDANSKRPIFTSARNAMTVAQLDIPERSAGVAIFSAMISILRWIILLVILVLLAPYLLDYFDNARTNAGAKYIYDGRDYLLRTAGSEIRTYIPVRIGGKDRTDWILVAGLVLAAGVLGSLRRRVENASMRRRMRRQVRAWKRDMHIDDNSAASNELERKIEGIRTGKGVDRQELLKIFAETKKKLDTLAREVAFLSIDVVGSAAMKEREDAASVQYDFSEYRKLVENVFRARGVLKSSWTPDGVMACFSNVDEAVSAGKDVIKGLDHFNKNVKLMTRDFSVRCGVNAGLVHFDESTPLEAMSDRVIDIAGHMQKHAKPGSVAVARKVIEPLRNRQGFESTEKIVDGYEVSQWVPASDR